MVSIPGYQINKQIFQEKKFSMYRASREGDGQPVILKKIDINDPSSSAIKQYRHEYEVLRSLNNEGIIRVLDLLDLNSQIILVYQDIGADFLFNFSNETSYSVGSYLLIATNITSALEKVHRNGFIHRRINPSNILYHDESHRIQLINFEHATNLVVEQMVTDSSEVNQKTMAYIAPEQTGKMSRPLDFRSDLYSLGAILYELFSGKPMFQTNDILEIVHSHVAIKPKSPKQVNPAVPKPLSDIIMKLLAKEVNDRYLSTTGVKYDLNVCLDQYIRIGDIKPFGLQKKDISDKFKISGKLYGREDDINVLKKALDRIGNGGPELVLVTGHAGIGKTALVSEALQKYAIEKKNIFLLLGKGRFDKFHKNIPYSAIAKSIRDIVRQILTQSDHVVEKWKNRLTEALGSNGSVITEIIPEVEVIIGPQPALPKLEAIKSQNRLNLVFQNFMRSLSGPSHPLILFLDDYQNADTASVKLIETILTDTGLNHFLSIVAYRDDEINTEHPFHKSLVVLKGSKARLTWLRMASLDLKSVKSIIADSLHADFNEISEIGALTLQKTDGNPFFIEMFLTTLRNENILIFNSDKGRWQWSITKINQLEITDNVADLLVQKVKSLAMDAQSVLNWASCIGIDFGLSEVKYITNKSLPDIEISLRCAVDAGIIIPLKPVYIKKKTSGASKDDKVIKGRFRFVHDRIRQAIYGSLTDQMKKKYHAKIGHYLLTTLSKEGKSKQLFAITNHLNVGSQQTFSFVSPVELAQYNLNSGTKAKAAAAFLAAYNYFNYGLIAIGSSPWKKNYELTKNLYLKTAETAYLCGKHLEMNKLVSELIQNANSTMDKVNAYEIIINSHIAQYQFEKAKSTALKILAELNLRLPSKASRWKVIRGFMSAKTTLVWKDIENLYNLEEMRNPETLAIMRIFSSVGAAAYFSDQDLLAIMTFKAVQIFNKYGNSPECVIWYSIYGLILCSTGGDINAGFKFGQLSTKLLEKFNVPELASQSGHLVNAFISHWKIHLRETLAPLNKAYRIGLETGNFEYAGYGAIFYCFHSLLAGIELNEVKLRIKTCSDGINRSRHEFSYTFLQIYDQTIHNLIENVDDQSKLSGPFYDEDLKLSTHLEANDKTTLASVYLVKLYLNYIYGEYNTGVKYAKKVEEYSDGITGTISIPMFNLYDSLTHLAIYDHSDELLQKKILKKISENQKNMKHWAKHSPKNHEYKYEFVEAEKCAAMGKKNLSLAKYRKAAKLARRHGYRNDEALILERQANYLSKIEEKKLAADTMISSRNAYVKWGAKAKVRKLDAEYSLLLIGNKSDARIETDDSHNKNKLKEKLQKENLDMAAVMKATQAISKEIVLEKLVDQLMQIIIENAGAQKGALILKKGKDLVIKASVEADTEKVDANKYLPVEESEEISLDIVRYVERTGEPIVIHNASEDKQFYGDIHLLEQRPKSILCMPILLKEKITGVLYLENNLASNVFTKERVKILNILLAQAAISLENAQLYENLKNEVNVRKKAEERLLHLATALEQAAEGILITEVDGSINYANPACENIFGYSQNEIIGKNTKEFRSGLQSDSYFRTIGKTLVRGDNWSGRMSSKKKDGTICELEVTVSPIRDANGNISSYVSVSRDMTREIQMEKELRQAQKMEAMGTLAGGIAHDFNNILAAVMGYTELAMFQVSPESPIQQNLERVITSTRRAKDLVRQILAFSRQTDQEARPIQLRLLIKEALKMLRASLPSTIEMQNDVEKISSYVEADPTQIHQVVMNLCTNAAHAMPDGGLLKVTLDEYVVDGNNHHLYPEVMQGQFLRLTVEDTGEGIKKQIIERVFEPFFTTKDPGKGTGMGLAMVHGIIKRCEGAIRVDSEVNKGTIFKVLFPKYHGTTDQDEDAPKGDIVPGKERIMFVDDEKALVTLVKEGLQRIGYQVHLETNSNKALSAFKENPHNFDLVITDQTMPKLTGMELSREIIQIRPDIPIILYSGLMDEITAEMIESVGIRSFLSKPLMLKQLSEAIRDVLDKSSADNYQQ